MPLYIKDRTAPHDDRRGYRPIDSKEMLKTVLDLSYASKAESIAKILQLLNGEPVTIGDSYIKFSHEVRATNAPPTHSGRSDISPDQIQDTVDNPEIS